MTMPENQVVELLDPSLSCFGGEDGGIGFMNLRMFLIEIQTRVNEGDENALEIIRVVEKFNRLLKISGGISE